MYTAEVAWTPIVLHLRHEYRWPLLYDCAELAPNDAASHDQKRLVAQCDLLIAAQPTTIDAWKTQSRATLYVPDSVDTGRFAGVPAVPAFFAEMVPPVALYSGAINNAADVAALRSLAQQRPQWHFLFWNTTATDVSSLDAPSNVSLIEKPAYQQLPAYLFYANVGIVPFAITPTEHRDDELHVREYLSVGTPVVALQQPALQTYQGSITLAGTSEQFLAALDGAWHEIDTASAAKGKKLVSQLDWPAQIAQIKRSVTEALPKFSIIIIAYKHLDLTRQCIESILRDTTYPNFEIILVDNASPDSSRAYLRYLAQTEPRVKVVLNAPTGALLARTTTASRRQPAHASSCSITTRLSRRGGSGT